MVYLNNSSSSYPKPKNVNDAVIEYLNSLPIDYHRSGVSHSDMDNSRTNFIIKLVDLKIDVY